MSRNTAALAALASCLLAACTGSITEQGSATPPGELPQRGGAGGAPAPTTPGPGQPPAMTPGTPSGTTPPAPLRLPSPALRRLTVVQLQNALTDLFGAAAPDVRGELEPDSDISGYLSVGAAQTALSPTATEKLEAAVLRVARQVATAPDRARLVGCTPAAAKDDPCTRTFLRAIGRRAWRRPVGTDELARLTALASDAAASMGDAWAGIEYGLAALLLSPHFLYRAEIGAPDPVDAGRRTLGPWELASRLSFFLWNSLPDEPLLASAESGTLSDPRELRAQVQRLLDAPRARAAVATFVDEVFRLRAVDDLPQLPKVFPLVTKTIGPAMRTETLKLFEDLVFTRDADLRDALDVPRTFVDRELAKLYGLPAPSAPGFTEVALPDDGQRRGILGHGAILATTSHASTTSPTLRGKFVREVLLCQTVPPPPPDVPAQLPEDEATGARTMREKLATHAKVAACAACHRLMDPIGLGLETFDGLGALRTTDAGKPIDASGELDGVRFADARALARAVRMHPNTAACLVRHLFRYALGYIEGNDQQAALDELDASFARDGHRLRALAAALASSAAFRSVGALE